MPISEYPFQAIHPGSRPRPMLPIRIINPHTGSSMQSWGLVDTGADDCAIPASYAAILGHALTAGAVKQITTGNGATNSYAHTTRIEIMPIGGASGHVAYVIPDAPVDFLPNLGVILLGTNKFLSKFILTIDYPRKVFSIKTPKG